MSDTSQPMPPPETPAQCGQCGHPTLIRRVRHISVGLGYNHPLQVAGATAMDTCPECEWAHIPITTVVGGDAVVTPYGLVIAPLPKAQEAQEAPAQLPDLPGEDCAPEATDPDD